MVVAGRVALALVCFDGLACSLATDLSDLSVQYNRDGAAESRMTAPSAELDASLGNNDGVLAVGEAPAVDAAVDSGISAERDAEMSSPPDADMIPSFFDGAAPDAPDAPDGGELAVDAPSLAPGDALDLPAGQGDAVGSDVVSTEPDASDAAPATSTCGPAVLSAATLALASASDISTCGYARAELPMLFVAPDPQIFDGSNACGGCVRIQTADAVVEAPVVDLGASLGPGNQPTLLASPAALAKLLPGGATFTSSGVSWKFVSCSTAPPAMTFTLQAGSNPTYSAVLVQYQRNRISRVEYKEGGVYLPLTRTSYNYWVSTRGMGSGPFTLRITDVFSQAVEQAGIPLAPGVPFQGDVQFAPCPN